MGKESVFPRFRDDRSRKRPIGRSKSDRSTEILGTMSLSTTQLALILHFRSCNRGDSFYYGSVEEVSGSGSLMEARIGAVLHRDFEDGYGWDLVKNDNRYFRLSGEGYQFDEDLEARHVG
jgi:hypothetical protein